MNYHIEVFIYWILSAASAAYLFYTSIKRVKNAFEKQVRTIPETENTDAIVLRLAIGSAASETLVSITFLISIAFMTYAVIFPTPLSAPTVRITAQGDIAPLPYGAWEWEMPKNEDYVRLEKDFYCNNIKLAGRTKDGVFMEGNWVELLGGITYEITDFAVFYKNYKATGRDSFCDEVNAVIFLEVFGDTKIFPNSEENIASADEKQKLLRERLINILKEKFRDKGVTVVVK